MLRYATVDDADHAELAQHRWFLMGGNTREGEYAARHVREDGKRRVVYMHRQITGLKPGDGLDVDHCNGRKLDNRRKNLLVCTRRYNLLRRPGAKHITKLRTCNRWQVVVAGRYLGLYPTPEAAERAAFKRLVQELEVELAKVNR